MAITPEQKAALIAAFQNQNIKEALQLKIEPDNLSREDIVCPAPEVLRTYFLGHVVDELIKACFKVNEKCEKSRCMKDFQGVCFQILQSVVAAGTTLLFTTVSDMEQSQALIKDLNNIAREWRKVISAISQCVFDSLKLYRPYYFSQGEDRFYLQMIDRSLRDYLDPTHDYLASHSDLYKGLKATAEVSTYLTEELTNCSEMAQLNSCDFPSLTEKLCQINAGLQMLTELKKHLVEDVCETMLSILDFSQNGREWIPIAADTQISSMLALMFQSFFKYYRGILQSYIRIYHDCIVMNASGRSSAFDRLISLWNLTCTITYKEALVKMIVPKVLPQLCEEQLLCQKFLVAPTEVDNSRSFEDVLKSEQVQRQILFFGIPKGSPAFSQFARISGTSLSSVQAHFADIVNNNPIFEPKSSCLTLSISTCISKSYLLYNQELSLYDLQNCLMKICDDLKFPRECAVQKGTFLTTKTQLESTSDPVCMSNFITTIVECQLEVSRKSKSSSATRKSTSFDISSALCEAQNLLQQLNCNEYCHHFPNTTPEHSEAMQLFLSSLRGFSSNSLHGQLLKFHLHTVYKMCSSAHYNNSIQCKSVLQAIESNITLLGVIEKQHPKLDWVKKHCEKMERMAKPLRMIEQRNSISHCLSMYIGVSKRTVQACMTCLTNLTSQPEHSKLNAIVEWAMENGPGALADLTRTVQRSSSRPDLDLAPEDSNVKVTEFIEDLVVAMSNLSFSVFQILEIASNILKAEMTPAASAEDLLTAFTDHATELQSCLTHLVTCNTLMWRLLIEAQVDIRGEFPGEAKTFRELRKLITIQFQTALIDEPSNFWVCKLIEDLNLKIRQYFKLGETLTSSPEPNLLQSVDTTFTKPRVVCIKNLRIYYQQGSRVMAVIPQAELELHEPEKSVRAYLQCKKNMRFDIQYEGSALPLNAQNLLDCLFHDTNLKTDELVLKATQSGPAITSEGILDVYEIKIASESCEVLGTHSNATQEEINKAFQATLDRSLNHQQLEEWSRKYFQTFIEPGEHQDFIVSVNRHVADFLEVSTGNIEHDADRCNSEPDQGIENEFHRAHRDLSKQHEESHKPTDDPSPVRQLVTWISKHWKQVICAGISIASIAGGMFIIVSVSGGLACIPMMIGSALIVGGIGAGVKLRLTSADDLTFCSYLKSYAGYGIVGAVCGSIAAAAPLFAPMHPIALQMLIGSTYGAGVGVANVVQYQTLRGNSSMALKHIAIATCIGAAFSPLLALTLQHLPLVCQILQSVDTASVASSLCGAPAMVSLLIQPKQPTSSKVDSEQEGSSKKPTAVAEDCT